MTKIKPKISPIKKYKSAYIYFTQEKIPIYKKLYPNLSLREIFKLIGKEWKQIKKKEKGKYYELEKKSKEIFNKIKEKGKYKYIKKQIMIKKPKRNRTSFMIYLHENKNKINKDNCIESLRSIGQKWKDLTDKERDLYIKKSEEDKKRYKIELVEYLKNKDIIEKKDIKKYKKIK